MEKGGIPKNGGGGVYTEVVGYAGIRQKKSSRGGIFRRLAWFSPTGLKSASIGREDGSSYDDNFRKKNRIWGFYIRKTRRWSAGRGGVWEANREPNEGTWGAEKVVLSSSFYVRCPRRGGKHEAKRLRRKNEKPLRRQTQQRKGVINIGESGLSQEFFGKAYEGGGGLGGGDWFRRERPGLNRSPIVRKTVGG